MAGTVVRSFLETHPDTWWTARHIAAVCGIDPHSTSKYLFAECRKPSSDIIGWFRNTHGHVWKLRPVSKYPPKCPIKVFLNMDATPRSESLFPVKGLFELHVFSKHEILYASGPRFTKNPEPDIALVSSVVKDAFQRGKQAQCRYFIVRPGVEWGSVVAALNELGHFCTVVDSVARLREHLF